MSDLAKRLRAAQVPAGVPYAYARSSIELNQEAAAEIDRLNKQTDEMIDCVLVERATGLGLIREMRLRIERLELEVAESEARANACQRRENREADDVERPVAAAVAAFNPPGSARNPLRTSDDGAAKTSDDVVCWLLTLNGAPEFCEGCVARTRDELLADWPEADGYGAMPLFAFHTEFAADKVRGAAPVEPGSHNVAASGRCDEPYEPPSQESSFDAWWKREGTFFSDPEACARVAWAMARKGHEIDSAPKFATTVEEVAAEEERQAREDESGWCGNMGDACRCLYLRESERVGCPDWHPPKSKSAI